MAHVNPKTPKARAAEKAEQSEAAAIKRQILSPGIPVLPGYRDCDQQPVSTCFSRTAPEDQPEGEGAMPTHHQEGKTSKVVGRDGEVYPPAREPWSGETIASLEHCKGPEPKPPERVLWSRARAEAADFDYASEPEAAIKHRWAWAALRQKQGAGDPFSLASTADAYQEIIEACQWELDRRRRNASR